MNAGIILFPGTNRERDMALRHATGHRPRMLWHRDAALPVGPDLMVLAGGFSYGDYLRCGAMAAHSPIMQAVKAFAAQGGHVLGVCPAEGARRVKASLLIMAALTVLIGVGLRWREERVAAARPAKEPRTGCIAARKMKLNRWVTAAALAAVGTILVLGELH